MTPQLIAPRLAAPAATSDSARVRVDEGDMDSPAWDRQAVVLRISSTTSGRDAEQLRRALLDSALRQPSDDDVSEPIEDRIRYGFD